MKREPNIFIDFLMTCMVMWPGLACRNAPKGRTADDQYFERLDQCRDLAVGKHVSAEHAREYDDDADNFSHRFKALAVVVRGRDGSFKTLLLLIGRTAPDYSHSMRKASSD
ncbi:hypothetical protein PPS11_17725 [Pseudomonas putida S11]|nr:hypothetical protein PPS11_17725 [Pseudomonas putida S11]